MATININQIKFNLFNVALGTTTARVSYSLDNRADGRKCVTLYARDYTRMLSAICGPEVSENNSDIMTDYFEKDRVTYFEGHPLYAAPVPRLNVVPFVTPRTRQHAGRSGMRNVPPASNTRTPCPMM